MSALSAAIPPAGRAGDLVETLGLSPHPEGGFFREVHRAQEEEGLSIQQIDQAIQEAKKAPMGPFFLVDLLGLDTVLHVAEHLQASYGAGSFYVHRGMKALVEAGGYARARERGTLRLEGREVARTDRFAHLKRSYD